MDFETLQHTRESCRVYSDRPVSRETLAHLIDVARLSPSACNSQPWHFIIVDEPEARQKVIEGLNDHGVTGCIWGSQVPAFIFICEEKAQLRPAIAKQYGSQYFAQMDIGMAAMSLCYEAASIGLGTCIIGTLDRPKLEASFGIPAECALRLMITVGYPAKNDGPRKKVRKNLDELISWNHW